MPQLARVGTLMEPPFFGGDVTPPTLSVATASSVGPATATPGVTTNEDNGTLYFVLVPNGDVPSAAQIKAGQQSSGAAAIGSGNMAVVSIGAKTFTAVTGLTPITAYDIWYLQRDLAGNDSTAVKYDLTTAAIGLSNGATVVTATTITITADSDYTLVGAVYGVEYSIGVGAPYAFSQSVAGAAANQSIALTIAAIGAVAGDTVNLRCYYNLDVLDAPGTRVYDGTFVVLLPASFLELHDGASALLLESGSKLLMEVNGVSTAIDALAAAAALADANLTMGVQAAASVKIALSDIKTYVNA